jgi:hypothetical protein
MGFLKRELPSATTRPMWVAKMRPNIVPVVLTYTFTPVPLEESREVVRSPPNDQVERPRYTAIYEAVYRSRPLQPLVRCQPATRSGAFASRLHRTYSQHIAPVLRHNCMSCAPTIINRIVSEWCPSGRGGAPNVRNPNSSARESAYLAPNPVDAPRNANASACERRRRRRTATKQANTIGQIIVA